MTAYWAGWLQAPNAAHCRERCWCALCKADRREPVALTQKDVDPDPYNEADAWKWDQP